MPFCHEFFYTTILLNIITLLKHLALPSSPSILWMKWKPPVPHLSVPNSPNHLTYIFNHISSFSASLCPFVALCLSYRHRYINSYLCVYRGVCVCVCVCASVSFFFYFLKSTFFYCALNFILSLLTGSYMLPIFHPTHL